MVNESVDDGITLVDKKEDFIEVNFECDAWKKEDVFFIDFEFSFDHPNTSKGGRSTPQWCK